MKKKLLTAGLAGIVLLGLAGCSLQSKADEAFAAVALKSHSAVTPVPQDAQWAQSWWMPRHKAVNERVKKGNVDLILIGDSITHGWENMKDLWEKYYAPRNAVNMGFSGDRTQHVLWRLENGNIDGINPKLAVIMIGTNNSNGNDNTAEEIADGIIAICAKLRKELPETKILILAIFPRAEKPCPQREKNAKASQMASQIADEKMIYYLDIGQKFLEEDGTLPKEIMPDFLHPNEKGYKIWAEAVEDKIAELMGE
jgi:beta-glucosidase